MQSEWACRAGDYGGEYYRYKVDGVELAADVCARYYENSNVSSATGDSDLSAGTAAENPLTDYCGRDISSVCYRTFGGAWSHGLTIWYNDNRYTESAKYKTEKGDLKCCRERQG